MEPSSVVPGKSEGEVACNLHDDLYYCRERYEAEHKGFLERLVNQNKSIKTIADHISNAEGDEKRSLINQITKIDLEYNMPKKVVEVYVNLSKLKEIREQLDKEEAYMKEFVKQHELLINERDENITKLDAAINQASIDMDTFDIATSNEDISGGGSIGESTTDVSEEAKSEVEPSKEKYSVRNALAKQQIKQAEKAAQSVTSSIPSNTSSNGDSDSVNRSNSSSNYNNGNQSQYKNINRYYNQNPPRWGNQGMGNHYDNHPGFAGYSPYHYPMNHGFNNNPVFPHYTNHIMPNVFTPHPPPRGVNPNQFSANPRFRHQHNYRY